MSVAGKVIKNCSLPITAKLGATIGMGTAALISYRVVQNNMTPYRPMAKLDIKVDKINANISPNKKSLLPENISKQDNSNNLEDNMHNISELDLEQLKLDYYLQLVILYLLLIILVFLIMKAISEKDLKLYY